MRFQGIFVYCPKMSIFAFCNRRQMKKSDNNISGWKLVLVNLAAMVLVVIVILLMLFHWMKNYTRHGEYIAVPDVTGMVEDEAAARFKAEGLRYEISDSKYDAGLLEGQVIEQRPSAGSNVKAGRIVYLTVNSGKIPTKKLPDVADNSSIRAAESKLLGAGFRLTEPEYIPGEKDWVYEVRIGDRKIEAGEEIPEGSVLTIYVGNGEDELEQLEDSLQTTGLDSDFF